MRRELKRSGGARRGAAPDVQQPVIQPVRGRRRGAAVSRLLPGRRAGPRL